MTHKEQNTLTIKEFSNIFNLNESTIRYYESQSLLISKRDKNNRRYFDETDVSWLKFLLHLKGTGMSLNDMKKYVIWRAQGDDTMAERVELLEKTRDEFLKDFAQVQHHLQVLNDKIDWYNDKLNGEINDEEQFIEYLSKIGHED
ncbi:MerR family transcriptional regulator [Lentilactobacillus sp. SPB1-3]|uniref:MerR family transcriptional regulator n=1 Tax=Lentilactobacillus terminaliae TaxID=3003483 RepID=A0ACD5DDY0_9LACO|nr:MerR family transcriptional regulator [Lentilactobacillus sp. SPB1-3]MCZ0977719.1 MerR family transcriptional regulator [Lentilactobacillus sp. SPB1-3]